MSIRSPEVERLARILSRQTGSTLTEAIRGALESRMKELNAEKKKRMAIIASISQECGAVPDLDSRSFEETLGYDSHGTFGHDSR